MVPSELKWHIMPNEKSGDEFKPFAEGVNGTFRIFSGYGAKTKVVAYKFT